MQKAQLHYKNLSFKNFINYKKHKFSYNQSFKAELQSESLAHFEWKLLFDRPKPANQTQETDHKKERKESRLNMPWHLSPLYTN